MPKRKHDTSSSDDSPPTKQPCVAPFRTVHARNFVPELDIELGNIVALFGRKGAGKSSAMRSLCRALAPRIDLAVVFSPTAFGNNYQDFVPCKYIFNSFNEIALQKIMDFQIEAAKKKKTCYNVLVILDDLAFDTQSLKSKTMAFMAYNCRWARITVIVASQYPNKIPAAIRDQVDIAMTSYFSSADTQEDLYKQYFNVFGKLRDFKVVLKMLTKNRQFMVKKSVAGGSDSVEESILFYRATVPEVKFRIGNQVVWSKQTTKQQQQEKKMRKMFEQKMLQVQQEADMANLPIVDVVQDNSRVAPVQPVQLAKPNADRLCQIGKTGRLIPIGSFGSNNSKTNPTNPTNPSNPTNPTNQSTTMPAKRKVVTSDDLAKALGVKRVYQPAFQHI